MFYLLPGGSEQYLTVLDHAQGKTTGPWVRGGEEVQMVIIGSRKCMHRYP
jgi:hypothetical protein